MNEPRASGNSMRPGAGAGAGAPNAPLTHGRPPGERLTGREMLLLWVGVLLGPIVWAVSLSSMFWLTHPVCQGMGRGVLWLTGAACVVVSLVALIGSAVRLARTGFPPERAGLAPFMLRLGVGASAIFALVILLSMAPIALLTPCPL